MIGANWFSFVDQKKFIWVESGPSRREEGGGGEAEGVGVEE